MTQEKNVAISPWVRVLRALPVPVAVVDREGRYVLLRDGKEGNAVFDRALLGRTDLDRSGGGPQARRHARERKRHFAEVVSKREPRFFQENRKTSQGNVLDILWLCVPMNEANCEVEHVALIGFDITDQDLPKFPSRPATQQSLRGNHVDLIDQIAKELRLPLAAMVTLTTPLASMLDGETHEMAVLIDKGGREVLQRLDSLLEDARSGKDS